MKFGWFGAIAVMALAFAGEALGDPVNLTRTSPPNSYFNRPGADLATHDTELRECMFLAARAAQPNAYGYSPSLLGAVITAAVLAGMDAVETNHAARANAENCMVVRRWRVIEIPTDQADEIAKLPQPAQAERLKDWVGAADPPGQVVRQWNNDGAVGATAKFERAPLIGARPNLSFTARDHSQDGKLPPATPQPSIWNRSQGEAAALKPGQLDKAPSDDAIVVIFVTGSGIHAGDTLTFRRVGPDPEVSPRIADKLPDMFAAYDNWVWHKAGQWYAFAVPAGRWRIDAVTEIGTDFELNFCFGSPAFDVRAGEVVFAGTFNLSQDYIGPDLTLDPARAWLGAGRFADALRAATYLNGARAKCGGSYLYNYEVTGAPYVDGYAWGSAVRAPAAAASPAIPTDSAAPPNAIAAPVPAK